MPLCLSRSARWLGVLLAAFLAAAALPLVGAQAVTLRDGSVDTSLGGAGVVSVTRSTISSQEGADGVAVQSDGRTVHVGAASTTSGQRGVVYRYTTSGAPDTTFSGDGRLLVSAAGSAMELENVAVMSDGRIVAVGRTIGADSAIVVVRLTADGKPDKFFSTDGIVIFDPSGGADVGVDLAVLADRRVLVAARTPDGAALVRLTAAGAIDAGFAGGFTYQPVANLTDPQAMEVDSSGGAVVVGSVGVGLVNQDAVLARFTPGGVLDTSFDSDGTRVLQVSVGAADVLRGVGIDPAGRIVAVGQAVVAGTRRLLGVRLLPNGANDPTWAGGAFSTPAAAGEFPLAKGMALTRDGRAVVALEIDNVVRVVRFTSAGALDLAFGQNGTDGLATATYTRPTGGTPATYAEDVVIGRNGRISVVGLIDDFGSDGPRGFIARFLGDRIAPTSASMSSLPTVSVLSSRTVSWTATDDNTGVASYDVLYSSASATSGAFGALTTWRSKTTATSGSFSGAAGRTYCFRVRAYDRAANAGAVGARSCVAFPVDDRGLVRSGSWSSQSSSADYRGTTLRSTTLGASLSLPGADYRRLALVATTCAACGSVKVYRGSTLLKTVSLVSATTKHRVVIPIGGSSTVRSGTITVRQASSGKAVIIDGLVAALL